MGNLFKINYKGECTKLEKSEFKIKGKIPIISQEKEFISGYTDLDIIPINDLPLIVFGDHTKILKYIDFEFIKGADGVKLLKPNTDYFIPKAFYYILENMQIEGIQSYSRHFKYLSKTLIPLPPKSIQEQIIDEILNIEAKEQEQKDIFEELEKEIWQLLIPSFQNAPKAKIDSIAKLERGRFSYRPRNAPHLYRDGIYPFIQTGNVANAKNGKIIFSQTLNEEGLKVSRLFEANTILITIAANIGNTAILDYPACFPDSLVSIRPQKSINIYYLEYFLRTQKEYLNEIAPQSAQKNLNLERLSPLSIPIPSIQEQNNIINKVLIFETQKQEIDTFLSTIQEQKENVLKKYL